MFGIVTVLHLWIMIFKIQFDSITEFTLKLLVFTQNCFCLLCFSILCLFQLDISSNFLLFFHEFSFKILFWKLCHSFKCFAYVFWEITQPFILFKFTEWFIVSYLSFLISLMFCTDCIHLKRSGHLNNFVSFVHFRSTEGINGAEDS